MDRDEQWLAIEAERRSLADLLDGLTPGQWASPSLCTEWRVQDVAAHVAMTWRMSAGIIVTGLGRSRGDAAAFGRDLAIADAERPPSEIVAELRREAATRTKPFVTSVPALLSDVIVHGQDIAVPLGIDRATPREAAVAGFLYLWQRGWPFYPRTRLAGTQLVATDADVAVGNGAAVEGPLSALTLLVSMRISAAMPRLRGPGVDLVAGVQRRLAG